MVSFKGVVTSRVTERNVKPLLQCAAGSLHFSFKCLLKHFVAKAHCSVMHNQQILEKAKPNDAVLFGFDHVCVWMFGNMILIYVWVGVCVCLAQYAEPTLYYWRPINESELLP